MKDESERDSRDERSDGADVVHRCPLAEVRGPISHAVATRRHVDVAEPIGTTVKARSTSKSAVSRWFVKATEMAMAELLSRDLSWLDVAVFADVDVAAGSPGRKRWAAVGMVEAERSFRLIKGHREPPDVH